MNAITVTAVEPRRARPVVFWAGLGAAVIALQVYVFTAWILSGPTRTMPGPDEQPWYMDISVAFMNVGMPIGAAAVLVLVVILPWRRAGRVSPDGLLVLGLMGVAWQDPLVNYVQVVATYNANVWNFGSWGPQIPGWLSPQGSVLAEPIAGFVPAYVFTAFLLVVATCRVMDRAKQQWPRIGTVGLITAAIAFNLGSGVAAELLAIRSGLYAFGGAIQSLSLFPGTRFQLPIYEAVCNAVLMTGFAAIRYFRNERGESIAERGIDRLHVGPRQRTWVRGFAVLGAVNATFFIYNLGWSVFTLDPDPWPEDLVERSYLVDEVCGPETDYACPGPGIPIPKGDSGYVDANGEFVPAESG